MARSAVGPAASLVTATGRRYLATMPPIPSPVRADIRPETLIRATALNAPAQTYATAGALIVPEADLSWTDDDWRELQRLCDEAEHAHVVMGDVDDPHDVWVARMVSDLAEVYEHRASAREILRRLQLPKMRELFASIIGPSEICIRRVQSHRVKPEGFIGLHADTDTNPDYLVAGVVHFGSTYTGGEYLVHHPTLGDQYYRPEGRAIMFARPDIPHQVCVVHSGQRSTMSFFLSRWFGATRKRSEA